MLFNKTSATEKRQALRDGLKGSAILRVPGAFNPLCARAIEEAGFDGVYISGAVLSADLALPDIGLTTLSEVAGRGQQIARVTTLPAIIDIDTGFGEPMSVARTIQTMEDAGIAGCHLEDQVNPKRCGHLDNKSVVEVAEMQRKLRAAADAKRDPNFLLIARTDARAIEGLDKAIDRARAYVDAGAEMIFPEAMADESEFEAFRKALDVPILANMTEFGKSRLLDAKTLEAIGIDLVIYPVTTLRLAMKAAIDGLAAIATDGHQNNIIGDMQTRKDLYELLRYEDYNHFDQSIFNFTV
ncbi:MAG: methylisocitrate lyase [Azospirillaceae bacterium]